jgi:hypothetical protein
MNRREKAGKKCMDLRTGDFDLAQRKPELSVSGRQRFHGPECLGEERFRCDEHDTFNAAEKPDVACPLIGASRPVVSNKSG